MNPSPLTPDQVLKHGFGLSDAKIALAYAKKVHVNASKHIQLIADKEGGDWYVTVSTKFGNEAVRLRVNQHQEFFLEQHTTIDVWHSSRAFTTLRTLVYTYRKVPGLSGRMLFALLDALEKTADWRNEPAIF